MSLKIYLTVIGLCLCCALLQAQCEKEISTNQLNPFNDEFLPLMNDWYPNHHTNPSPYTVNSFLNTSINWSPGTSIILDLNAGWESNFGIAENYIMRNPFAGNHHPNHLNSAPRAPGSATDRDWRWADGWELLWMNISKYPNGDY